MRSVNEVKQEISLVFSPIIGEFRIKTYFSYYAIFKNGLMIALYQNGTTYLRISQKHTEMIRSHPETYNLCDNKLGQQTKKFYYIPNTILFHHTLFKELTFAILNELNEEKQQLTQKRSTQIRTLPNMNLKLERMLKKVGICSVADFISSGYISVFIKLIQQGFDVSEDLLFKLNGALTHQYIYTFTETQKKELLTEANQALYDIGLRKRFNLALYS